MSMTVQKHVNLRRWARWRDVLKSNSQSTALDVQHQRPLIVVITVSAHNQNLRTNRAQFVEDVFRAHIAEMPDFIRLARKLRHIFGQTVMRVGENENAARRWSFGMLEWWSNGFDISNTLQDFITPLLPYSITPSLALH
jgi:hypothetical protein